jgi:hypothetical protein
MGGLKLGGDENMGMGICGGWIQSGHDEKAGGKAQVELKVSFVTDDQGGHFMFWLTQESGP